MRKMRKPENNVSEIVTDCTSNYRDSNLRDRHLSNISFIEDYTTNFENQMSLSGVHTIAPHDNVNGAVSKDEMVKLYTNKFSKLKEPGRKHYDKIIVSEPSGKCPICSVRSVTTIDHFMGKSAYPTLAVSPVNLIPTCRDCNIDKGEQPFLSSENVHLHPYFDDIDDVIWMTVEISNVSDDAIATYSVVKTKPEKWDKLLFERVRNHFVLFKLHKLYSLQAADEISGVKYKLQKIKAKVGITGLYQDMQDTLCSYEKISLNHWKAALYRGILESRWFMEDFL